MGFMDKVKGLLKGREKQAKSGIDTASNKVEEKVGPQHAAQVENVAEKAKDEVDKLSGTDAPGTGAPSGAEPASTEPPASPPPQAAPPSPPTGPPA
jgi:hypothetical protein